jgi:hypothetical protein
LGKNIDYTWNSWKMIIFRKKFSVTWNFGQMTHFSILSLGQKILLNFFSVERPFGKNFFRSNDFFQWNDLSVKWCFGEKAFDQKIWVKWFFDKMNQNHLNQNFTPKTDRQPNNALSNFMIARNFYNVVHFTSLSILLNPSPINIFNTLLFTKVFIL